MVKLIPSLGDNEFIICVFFYTFSQTLILLNMKLCLYGIRSNAQKCLTKPRKICNLKRNGLCSESISCDVPQNSMFGLLLFLVYIRYLCPVCRCTPILCADDTNLFASGSDIKIMECNIILIINPIKYHCV